MKQLILMIFLFCAGLNAQAMTELEFIERLRGTHPFFTQQALSSQIKQVEKHSTTADEDWIVGIDSNYKNENVSDISSLSSAYSKSETASIDVSATKKLFNSGSNISLKHSWIDKDKDRIGADTVRNRFSLDYTYPLLRNKDGINDRLNTDVAQISIEQNALEKLEKEENFILKKLVRFIELAYAQEQQTINENRLSLANQELNLVKQKYAASLVDKVDVLLQKDAYQRAQQQLLQAQQDLILLRHEIAIMLALDINKIVAKIDLYKIHETSSLNLKNQSLKASRLLKITDLEQKILKRQLLSFKNKSEMKLDFNLGLVSEGENTNNSDSLSNQSPTWKVGLGLSYPLGAVKSNSNVRKSELQLAQLAQYKQEQLLDLNTQATTLKEKINLLNKILKSNQKQITIAKARTVEEKNRYANGNGQASFVINAQNNEQTAQLSYAQVAKKYQKAVLEFRATIDQLTE